ncbi:MAG: hypothetical protein GXY44_13075 [Phycisphaerales bacterium]|nr:hypothetical protein [Phycisphaerales bacterium]
MIDITDLQRNIGGVIREESKASSEGHNMGHNKISTATPEAGVDETTRPHEPMGGLPVWLARSSVYRRVPVAVRSRLDAAILLRPQDCPTLEAIAVKYQLAERYGISRAALRVYAGKLEQLVRPRVASQVLAGVLGCLPVSYRRKLAAGSEVMLLSRLAQTLSNDNPSSLTVADLAKLAGLLKALGQTCITDHARKPRREKNRARALSAPESESAVSDSDRIAEAVRTLYGLSWPTDRKSEE